MHGPQKIVLVVPCLSFFGCTYITPLYNKNVQKTKIKFIIAVIIMIIINLIRVHFFFLYN